MSYIKGIHVSDHNGSIDFGKVANDGVEYVYMRATHGKLFKDIYLNKYYNDCKDNELKVGAYHLLVETSKPEAQAQNFYESITSYQWDLVPILNIETNFNGVSNYIERFITSFKKLCSLELGIYTHTNIIPHLSRAKATIKDMKFLEANYNKHPWSLENTFFTNRIGHQHIVGTSIIGVNGKCYIDSFTEDALLDNSLTTGKWISKDGKWYYSSGSHRKTGWQKINEKWYFFDSNGVMQTGWIKDKDRNYFLCTSGEMLCNCVKYVYGFDGDGKATRLNLISKIFNFINRLLKRIHK